MNIPINSFPEADKSVWSKFVLSDIAFINLPTSLFSLSFSFSNSCIYNTKHETYFSIIINLVRPIDSVCSKKNPRIFDWDKTKN